MRPTIHESAICGEKLDETGFVGLLRAWADGDEQALNRLMILTYDRLHHIARRQLALESADAAFHPSALVHEAFVRLRTEKRLIWHSRGQFFWYAGEVIRRILVEQARARTTLKRGAGWQKLSLDQAGGIHARQNLEPATMMSLHTALDKLKRLDSRQGHLVRLRFFVGLELEEIADLFKVSTRTLKRDWHAVKHWLAKELGSLQPKSLAGNPPGPGQ